MANWDTYQNQINKVRQEWDRAEPTLKRAEQVCEKIIAPSILELRYAGRRIVEGLNGIAEGLEEKEIQGYFQDAYFNCLRARHDAIDAATSKIAIDLDIAAKQLGYGPITQAFPKFSDLRLKLEDIRGKIVKSRGDREKRDEIYNGISENNFQEIVELYREFQTSEPVMVSLATKQRRATSFGWVFGIAGLVGLVVGLVSIL